MQVDNDAESSFETTKLGIAVGLGCPHRLHVCIVQKRQELVVFAVLAERIKSGEGRVRERNLNGCGHL